MPGLPDHCHMVALVMVWGLLMLPVVCPTSLRHLDLLAPSNQHLLSVGTWQSFPHQPLLSWTSWELEAKGDCQHPPVHCSQPDSCCPPTSVRMAALPGSPYGP